MTFKNIDEIQDIDKLVQTVDEYIDGKFREINKRMKEMDVNYERVDYTLGKLCQSVGCIKEELAAEDHKKSQQWHRQGLGEVIQEWVLAQGEKESDDKDN